MNIKTLVSIIIIIINSYTINLNAAYDATHNLNPILNSIHHHPEETQQPYTHEAEKEEAEEEEEEEEEAEDRNMQMQPTQITLLSYLDNAIKIFERSIELKLSNQEQHNALLSMLKQDSYTHTDPRNKIRMLKQFAQQIVSAGDVKKWWQEALTIARDEQKSETKPKIRMEIPEETDDDAEKILKKFEQTIEQFYPAHQKMLHKKHLSNKKYQVSPTMIKIHTLESFLQLRGIDKKNIEWLFDLAHNQASQEIEFEEQAKEIIKLETLKNSEKILKKFEKTIEQLYSAHKQKLYEECLNNKNYQQSPTKVKIVALESFLQKHNVDKKSTEWLFDLARNEVFQEIRIKEEAQIEAIIEAKKEIIRAKNILLNPPYPEI